MGLSKCVWINSNKNKEEKFKKFWSEQIEIDAFFVSNLRLFIENSGNCDADQELNCLLCVGVERGKFQVSNGWDDVDWQFLERKTINLGNVWDYFKAFWFKICQGLDTLIKKLEFFLIFPIFSYKNSNFLNFFTNFCGKK